MDIGKSITYPFEDKEWAKKLLLGIIISIVPILNFAWIGYMLRTMRNVYDGAETLLPDWSEFGDKFVKGLLVSIASFIYSLPAWIVLIPAGLLWIIPALSRDQSTAQTMAGLVGVATLIGGCCVTLYVLLLTFFLPAMYAHYSRLERFGACFQIREIFQLITHNLGNYFLAWLVAIVFGFVVGLVFGFIGGLVGWIPCIGWIIAWLVGGFATVWVSIVIAYLFGAVGKSAAPEAMVVNP